MKERELRDPVAEWLKGRGLHVAFERLFPSGYCDVLGFEFCPQTSRRIPPLASVVAVELKLNDISTALRQAEGYGRHSSHAFVAMPKARCDRMRDATIDKFVDSGVGLLGVEGSRVHVLVEASYMNDVSRFERQAKKLWRVLRETKD